MVEEGEGGDGPGREIEKTGRQIDRGGRRRKRRRVER